MIRENKNTAHIQEDTDVTSGDILSSLVAGVFWLDADYVVTGCNQTFLKDCGFSCEEEAIGRPIHSFFPPELTERIVNACSELKNNSASITIPVRGLFAPASKLIYTFRLTALPTSHKPSKGYLLTYLDAHAMTDAHREDRENRQKYQTLFEHADEGMWLIRDHHFTDANPAAARMLGYKTVQELSNLHPSELSPEFQPDGKPSFEKAGEMMELAQKNGRHRFEWNHKKKSGDVFPVDVSLVRVPLDGQDILLCTWRDISEQKKTQQALREARDTAESMTRLRSEFLSNMSHEIRTPMTGILGMLSLIPENELSEQNRSYVQKAYASAQALLNIINDILDLSRLEAGRMSVAVTHIDVPALVHQVVDLLENKAHEKGLLLKAQIADGFPSQITMDERHLRQILLNLVGNAIKFTHKGEIVISVEVDCEDVDRPLLKCVVTDTGIGIPTDKIDAVFDRFQQVDSSVSRCHEGTGLGLSICRELAELHGGEISIASEFGKGSTFTVLLPVEDGAPCCTLQTETPPNNSETETSIYDDVDISNVHVLVAEDNIVNQMVISKWLENLGISHEVQSNGAEVLMRLTSPKPDAPPVGLIIMDIQMPIIGGVETTKKIRLLNDPDVATLPIIALTANAMSGQGDDYIAAGMDSYMTKPIDFDALEHEMKRVMSR